jgi:hypothetical protein
VTFRYVPPFALRAFQLYLLSAAVVRGWNYLATPPRSTVAWSAMENSAPLWVWGALFAFFGTLGAAGELWMEFGQSRRKYVVSFNAHAALMCLYFGVGASAMQGIVDRSPPFFGFVTPYELIGYAMAHWLFMRRRKNAAEL